MGVGPSEHELIWCLTGIYNFFLCVGTGRSHSTCIGALVMSAGPEISASLSATNRHPSHSAAVISCYCMETPQGDSRDHPMLKPLFCDTDTNIYLPLGGQQQLGTIPCRNVGKCVMQPVVLVSYRENSFYTSQRKWVNSVAV